VTLIEFWLFDMFLQLCVLGAAVTGNVRHRSNAHVPMATPETAAKPVCTTDIIIIIIIIILINVVERCLQPPYVYSARCILP